MNRGKSVIPSLPLISGGGLVVGLIALAGVYVGRSSPGVNPYQSYLLGYVFWTSLTLGFLALTLLQSLTKGTWGYSIIRFLQTGSKMIPLMGVLFLPILLFGLQSLYPWARPEDVAHSAVLQAKVGYLNVDGFTVRYIVYFVLWTFMAFWLWKLSMDQDLTGNVAYEQKRMVWAGPFAVVFVISVTLAVTDWIMSLEVAWFSTIFGLLLVVGSALTALALTVAYLTSVCQRAPFVTMLPRTQFRDLGNLLLTLVILWAYMSFSQYLITWSGNLPEEASYYAERRSEVWRGVGAILIFLHFLLPFFLLLSSRLKRTPGMLRATVVWILLMRAVDICWAVVPSFHRAGAQINWMDVAAFIGIGGIWVAAFAWQLSRTELVPKFVSTREEVPDVV